MNMSAVRFPWVSEPSVVVLPSLSYTSTFSACDNSSGVGKACTSEDAEFEAITFVVVIQVDLCNNCTWVATELMETKTDSANTMRREGPKLMQELRGRRSSPGITMQTRFLNTASISPRL